MITGIPAAKSFFSTHLPTLFLFLFSSHLPQPPPLHLPQQDTLSRYKFSLAFENSCEPEYVTEKFWQSLVAGTVPVVVGAPNILNFAPTNDSILHIKVRACRRTKWAQPGACRLHVRRTRGQG